MFSARLLISALMLCSLSAFGQTEFIASRNSAGAASKDLAVSASTLQKSATPSDGRIISQQYESGQDTAGRISGPLTFPVQIENRAVLPTISQATTDRISIPLDAESRDSTCFAIRSYVVARDSKDSESTHPVAYSTCQPSSRYRLRKTLGTTAPER
jgi:hypothetical protein